MKKAVAGIVFYKNKILIGKKVIKKGHFVSGGWHIPGGYVIKGETEEEALYREFKEETNLDIKLIQKICSQIIKEDDVVLNWYICSTSINKVIPGDDLEEIKFVNKTKIFNHLDERAVRRYSKKIIEYLTSC